MTEALPVGNGALGAMLFGGTEGERWQLNADSLWTGDNQVKGSYQAFGDVLIELNHRNVTDYRRELDIDCALHRVSYVSSGIRYTRETFASHPAGVIVMCLTADHSSAYSGQVWLTDRHGATIDGDESCLRATGTLDNGLHYHAQLLVMPRAEWPKLRLPPPCRLPVLFGRSGRLHYRLSVLSSKRATG